MQPAGRHFRADQREPDPVIVRAIKSPMVFSPQVGSQRPNSSKLMTISSGKSQTSIFSNNSRFPAPGMFSTKVVTHEPGVSAFTVPTSTRSSAFNRVSGVQNPTNSRVSGIQSPAANRSSRNVVIKEETYEKSGTRMVWQPSSNEQVYRMAQISSQPAPNGSSSIIQIPPTLQNHHGIYLDQHNIPGQFYPYHPNSAQSSTMPIVLNPRELNSNIGYITTALNQRPSILRKLSKPSDRPHQDEQKDNGQSSSYSHGDPSVYSIKDKAVDVKPNIKLKTGNSDPYLFADSPRKKPRKQAVVAHEDVFASNVPQSVRCDIGPSTSFQAPLIKQDESSVEGQDYFYSPCKRMSLLAGYNKCPTRLNNHFEKYADIKVCKKKRNGSSIPELGHVTAQGWRMVHLKSQLDDISNLQKETKSKLCEYKDYFSNISLDLEDKVAGGGESVADLLQNINHCCQSNITQMKLVSTALDKLVNNHKPKVVELVKEFKEKSTLNAKKTPPYNTPTQQSAKTESKPSSSVKKTRKRKT